MSNKLEQVVEEYTAAPTSLVATSIDTGTMRTTEQVTFAFENSEVHLRNYI